MAEREALPLAGVLGWVLGGAIVLARGYFNSLRLALGYAFRFTHLDTFVLDWRRGACCYGVEI